VGQAAVVLWRIIYFRVTLEVRTGEYDRPRVLQYSQMYFAGQTRGRYAYHYPPRRMSIFQPQDNAQSFEKPQRKPDRNLAVKIIQDCRDNCASIFMITAGQVKPFRRYELEGVYLI